MDATQIKELIDGIDSDINAAKKGKKVAEETLRMRENTFKDLLHVRKHIDYCTLQEAHNNCMAASNAVSNFDIIITKRKEDRDKLTAILEMGEILNGRNSD